MAKQSKSFFPQLNAGGLRSRTLRKACNMNDKDQTTHGTPTKKGNWQDTEDVAKTKHAQTHTHTHNEEKILQPWTQDGVLVKKKKKALRNYKWGQNQLQQVLWRCSWERVSQSGAGRQTGNWEKDKQSSRSHIWKQEFQRVKKSLKNRSRKFPWRKKTFRFKDFTKIKMDNSQLQEVRTRISL